MPYSDELWKQAKAKCRLSMEDIERAKRLGLNPKSLMKKVPNKSEQWKAPVSVWLREIEDKREKKASQKQKRREKANKAVSNSNQDKLADKKE